MANDKLNPLKTKFELSIEIDSVEYKLTFKPVNKIIQEKLDKNRKESKAQYETVDDKRNQLKETKELKAVNDDLLKTHGEIGGIGTEQKTEILLENKKYVSDISSLEKDIKTLEKEVLDINSAVEQYHKEMFNECVSGEDIVKLKNTIEENGLSYSVIIVYINEALRLSQEKK